MFRIRSGKVLVCYVRSISNEGVVKIPKRLLEEHRTDDLAVDDICNQLKLDYIGLEGKYKLMMTGESRTKYFFQLY